MVKSRYRLICILFLLFGVAHSQTPVAPTPGDSNLEQSQPTAAPTRMSSGQDNFSSMSDLHIEALGQTTNGNAVIPTPTPSSLHRDFFDQARFQLEIGPTADFLGQNFVPQSQPAGFGLNWGLGCLLDDNWSLWLSTSTYTYPPFGSQYGYYYGLGDETLFNEVSFNVRYTFAGSWIRPYFTLGGGVFWDNYLYLFESSDTSLLYYDENPAAPMVQVGLGLLFPLNSDLSVFAEAKANAIFETLTNTTYTYTYPYYSGTPTTTYATLTAIDFPVAAGVVLNLFGDGKPSLYPTEPAEKNWFVKIGGGVSATDTLDLEGDNTTDFVSSTAVGIDFINHFSIFGSLDQYQGALGLMGNVQYALPLKSHFWSPYLFVGVGLDYTEVEGVSSSSLCYQLGLGMEFYLNPVSAIFVEGKAFIINPASPASYYYYDYPQSVYSAVLTGFKFSTASKPVTGSSPTVSANGQGFVEIAGAVDTPALNWQTAYTATAGSVLGAGYEFKDGLALQLDVENFYFTGNNFVGPVSDNVVRVLPTVRYHLFSGSLRPYVLAGLGTEIEFSISDYGNATVAYLNAVLGAGLDLSLGNQIDLFAEGKYNWVFADGVLGQDIPVLGGVRFGL